MEKARGRIWRKGTELPCCLVVHTPKPAPVYQPGNSSDAVLLFFLEVSSCSHNDYVMTTHLAQMVKRGFTLLAQMLTWFPVNVGNQV